MAGSISTYDSRYILWRCARRDRLPDFTLPTTKLGNPVTITASRYATPLPAMILRRVIEIEHARLGVGATTKIAQIRLGQEDSNLVGENREGQFAALQLRFRADKMESPLPSSVYHLLKTVPHQHPFTPCEKLTPTHTTR